MNEETKKRIAAINSGIIPEGYKKTKVGIVPVEWEDTHFSELFIEKKNITSDFEKYPLYSLTIEEGVVPKAERYERSHLVKKDDIFKIVSENDFVYNPMNVRFGALARYKGQEDVSVSGYYDIFSVKESVSKEYMENFLLSDPMINYYNRVSTGSLKEKQRVHFSQFLDFVLPIPPLPEQQKIAEILSTQDKLIELQEKKIEQLKELKKAYLQKMFPKKGSKYPELRFKGFTDPWEQRKFSDFAQRESAVEVSSPNCPCVEYEDVIAEEGRLNKDIKLKETQKTGIKFDGTQVLYGKLRPYLHNWLNPGFTGIAVGDWWVLRPICIDKDYLYRLIQTKQFDDVANQSAGSKMPRADWNLISNTEFFVPVSMEEQSKIAQAFTNLDTLITLHQRKSEQEKQKKKALMQLLLTGKVRCK